MTSLRFKVIACLLLVAILLSACAPKAEPVPASAPAMASPSPIAIPVSQSSELREEEWQRTVSAAQREGSVIVLCGDPSVRTPLSQEFRKKYGISAEFVIGRANERVAKVLAERRANLYLNDIFLSGTAVMLTELKPIGVLDPLEPTLVLPEVVDTKYWQGGKLRWADKERYVLIFLTAANIPLAINTDLVQPGEIKSYKDLLNPKWKGKITLNDPTVSGAGNQWFAAALASGKLDLDYMRKLVAQNPLVLRDQRLQIEWLARGKYPVTICPKSDLLREFKLLGSPVQLLIPLEGTYVSEGGGAASLLNRAPHPNAAKLFLNWLLSKEGQMIHSRAYGKASLRLDVPSDFVDPAELLQPGVDYFFLDEKFYVEDRPTYTKVAQEIFKSLIP